LAELQVSIISHLQIIRVHAQNVSSIHNGLDATPPAVSRIKGWLIKLHSLIV